MRHVAAFVDDFDDLVNAVQAWHRPRGCRAPSVWLNSWTWPCELERFLRPVDDLLGPNCRSHIETEALRVLLKKKAPGVRCSAAPSPERIRLAFWLQLRRASFRRDLPRVGLHRH